MTPGLEEIDPGLDIRPTAARAWDPGLLAEPGAKFDTYRRRYGVTYSVAVRRCWLGEGIKWATGIDTPVMRTFNFAQ